jgi:hypothetical protein
MIFENLDSIVLRDMQSYLMLRKFNGMKFSMSGEGFYSKDDVTKIYKIFNSKFPYERVRVR